MQTRDMSVFWTPSWELDLARGSGRAESILQTQPSHPHSCTSTDFQVTRLHPPGFNLKLSLGRKTPPLSPAQLWLMSSSNRTK